MVEVYLISPADFCGLNALLIWQARRARSTTGRGPPDRAGPPVRLRGGGSAEERGRVFTPTSRPRLVLAWTRRAAAWR